MAFQQVVVPLQITDTVIFTCPATSSGSIHGLIISNANAAIRNLTLKLFSQQTGVTTTIVGGAKPIGANSEFTWYKPININPGDKLIGSSSAGTADLVAIASIYLDTAVTSTILTPRGDWSGTATYSVGDLVTSSGSSYIAISSSINSLPPSINWMISAASVVGPTGFTGAQGIIGITGNQGIQGNIGLPFSVNAVGILANRGAYDVQVAGFTYLASDISMLYIRMGATTGTWSAAIPWGKGDKGDTGLQGNTGVQGIQGIQGIQGLTGTGIQGIQGVIGNQGIQGIMGPQNLTAFFPGSVFAQVSTQRIYPRTNINITSISSWLSALATSDVTTSIKVNGIVVQTVTIPTGINKVIVAASIAATPNDYFTVDVLGGVGKDLTVRVEY